MQTITVTQFITTLQAELDFPVWKKTIKQITNYVSKAEVIARSKAAAYDSKIPGVVEDSIVCTLFR